MKHGEQVAVIMLAQNFGAAVSISSGDEHVTIYLAYRGLANVGRLPAVTVVIGCVTPDNISGGVVIHVVEGAVNEVSLSHPFTSVNSCYRIQGKSVALSFTSGYGRCVVHH